MCLLLNSETYYIISSMILLNHPGMCNRSKRLMRQTLILLTGEGNEHMPKVSVLYYGGGSVLRPHERFLKRFPLCHFRLLNLLKSDQFFLSAETLGRYVFPGPENICQCWQGTLPPVSAMLPISEMRVVIPSQI